MEKRLGHIDILKTLAILGVITIHISSGPLLHSQIGSLDWFFSLFWASVVRWSVPVFLMCSGVLFLNPDKIITIKQLFAKYLLRIVIALIFWAVFYEMVDIIMAFLKSGYIDQTMIRKSIKKILTFNTHVHLYYIYIIILIYFLLPVMRVFSDAASKHQMEYAIFVWVILGVVFPFASKFYPFTLIKGIVAQYAINLAYSAIGYFILGGYLQRYTLRKRTTYIIYSLGILGLVTTIFGTIVGSTSSKTVAGMYLEGTAPNIAVMATALFLLIKNLNSILSKTVGRTIKVTRYISKASFCIYLVHVFFINIFRELNFINPVLSPIYSIPSFVLLTLILSLGVYFVLSKINVINKYII
jgi:surface polysaccharide O-acyltransferase-like enzyme